MQKLIKTRDIKSFRRVARGDRYKAILKSMQKHGMLYEITVKESGDGKYEVVDGAVRLAVAKELGMKTIPARIHCTKESLIAELELIVKSKRARELLARLARLI